VQNNTTRFRVRRKAHRHDENPTVHIMPSKEALRDFMQEMRGDFEVWEIPGNFSDSWQPDTVVGTPCKRTPPSMSVISVTITPHCTVTHKKPTTWTAKSKQCGIGAAIRFSGESGRVKPRNQKSFPTWTNCGRRSENCGNSTTCQNPCNPN
jgi:hypothetical protein